MKKICILLVLGLLFSLTACAGAPENPGTAGAEGAGMEGSVSISSDLPIGKETENSFSSVSSEKTSETVSTDVISDNSSGTSDVPSDKKESSSESTVNPPSKATLQRIAREKKVREVFSRGTRKALTEDEEAEIISLFLQKDPGLEKRREHLYLECFGVYGSTAVFFFCGGYAYTDAVVTTKIGNVTITYPNGQGLQACSEGVLYSLQEAYDKKLLTEEDLRNAVKSWTESDRYFRDRTSASSYFTPEVQQAWKAYSGTSENMVESGNFRYYATYRSVTVFLAYSSDGAAEVTVAGTSFRDEKPFGMFAYYKGEIKPLAEAYAIGWVSAEEVGSLLPYHESRILADLVYNAK